VRRAPFALLVFLVTSIFAKSTVRFLKFQILRYVLLLFQAIAYAETRACFRTGEIHPLESGGNLERTIVQRSRSEIGDVPRDAAITGAGFWGQDW
jgi:hypothetical protein